MSEHEKIELDDNDLAEISGGSHGLVIGIPKPQYIVFECGACGGLKNVSLDDYVFINSAPIAGGMCCGNYRKIKYHCPQCGSELVYYSSGAICCSACQKMTNSDGSVTAY